MNFTVHNFSVSAYMTLMFTSAFLTLNAPSPISFAAAGGGLDAVAGRISAHLEVVGMQLPQAQIFGFQESADGELKKAADRVESSGRNTDLPAQVCAQLGLNDGSSAIVTKSTATGTAQPRDIRGIQVFRQEQARHVVLSAYKGDEAYWFLTNENGDIKKVAYKKVGEGLRLIVPVTDAEPTFRREKTYWTSRFDEVMMVGQAGS